MRVLSLLLTVFLSGWFQTAFAAAVPPPPHCRLAINDTLLPDFSCSDSTSECYKQAVGIIQAQAAKQNISLEGCPVPPDESYLSEFDFAGQYSDYTFVFLPGLYDTAAQFWGFKGTFGANNGMRVVLPGHGASASQGGSVTPNDWMLATRRAVHLAGYLGKKVILVGQSTGAFLSVWAAAQPEFRVAGVAVFEPAMKVRSYYGGALCYIPSFDLSTIPHGRFFEENINLGCVIRTLSQEQTPKFESPQAFKRLSQIPFYVFVNPYDIVVNTSTTMKFVQDLKAAGGDVTLESYSRKYEGVHMHAAVVKLPLRARYAERLEGETSFDQTLRGRNSYAEFMATKFNICDSATDAVYLQSFGLGYNSLYEQRATVGRIDEAIVELQSITGTGTGSGETSATTRETLKAYQALYTGGLAERDAWSFPSDGVHYIMHETNWSELSGLCCDVFVKTKRTFTTSFVGPTYSTLQQQRAQASADLVQAISGRLDAATAQRLAAYLGGHEPTNLLSPLISGDFTTTYDWLTKKGKCGAWQDIPAMDISDTDIKTELRDFLSHQSQMVMTSEDPR